MNSKKNTTKTKQERHSYIGKLVKERHIRTQPELLTQLNNDGFKCALPTLKNDLKELGIKYNSNTKQYDFEADIARGLRVTKYQLNPSLLETIKICKVGPTGPYKLYPPFMFAGNKLHSVFIRCVMITCPLNYEEMLYDAISKNLSSHDILTVQINKGSLFFLFESNIQKDNSKAKAFYENLKEYLYF